MNGARTRGSLIVNKTESSQTSSSPMRRRLALIAGLVLFVMLPALLFALAQPASRATAIAQTCVPTATAMGQVNVRSGPSQAFEPPIGTIVAGQSVQVTGRLADNSWYRILFNGREGWVFGQLMATSCMGSVPVVPAPPPPATTPIPGPSQANFSADTTTLTQGQCTTLRWSVTEVAGVWLIAGQYQTSVPGVSTQTVCPGATTTYRLRVQRLNGSVFEEAITINVIPNTNQLPNPNFRAEAYSVSPGQCTTLRWNITGVRAVFFWDGASAQGVSGTDSRQVCPNSTTTYRLQVVYNDGQAQDWYVTVVVTSAGGDASITFAANPDNIQRGGCAVLIWQVAGPFSSITLFDTSNSSSSVVGADGNMTVCPENTTQYILRITGLDGRMTERSVTVGVFTASVQ
jgi:uncharacterized protein YraI